ncbi:MAG: xylulokinase [Nitrososphaeria archaeon]
MNRSGEKPNEVIICIDLGTTATKVGLVDVNGPRLISVMSREYPRGILHPKTTWAEGDLELWWKTVAETIKEIFSSTNIGAYNAVAIGVCNTCPSLTPIDRNGRALRPAILYMDQRSVQQAEKIRRKVGLDTLASIAGNRIAPGAFSATSMLWIKEEEPEIYRKAYKFVHANGFMGVKLTGQIGMDPTNASFTGIFDLRKARWSDDLSDCIGIDGDKLPDILWPYEKVGELSQDAAKELGVEKGIPVAMGCADSVSSALGCGITRPGRVFETTGTSTVVAVVSKTPTFDTRILNRCYIDRGLWLHMGAMSTSGGSLKWFKDNFCEGEVEEAAKVRRNPYEILDEEAESIGLGSDGLIFLPYLSGERSPIWDAYARGVFFGLSLSHTRYHMVRAILESVAYGLRNNIEIIESLGVKIEEIRVAGAASKSRLWRQIKADVLGKKVAVPRVKDSTMIGNAILAGCAAKLYDDIFKLSDRFYHDIEDVNVPDMIAHKKYDKYYHIYKNAYKRLKSMYRELALAN